MGKKFKILCVVGARPNFIKIAPLMEEFRKYSQFNPVLMHTGQHYDYKMSEAFFKELNIPKPDYNLGVGSGFHGEQTGKIMIEFEKICFKEKPDLIIVVGDVNSTLAGALVAAKLHIPVAHIEAGLRSGDMNMPEEINRRLTDHISNFLFCPTETAVKNLDKEGIMEGVYNVGDLMYNVFLKNIKIIRKRSKIFKILNLKPKTYCLLTLHRPSNVDNSKNFQQIIEAIQESGENIVFPIHPRTRKQLEKVKLKIDHLRFKIIPPLGYLDMLWLEKNAKKILTDSGGVQKEAYFVQVPCITLRDTTEWLETLASGWNILVGNNNKEKIINAIKKFNAQKLQYKYFGKGDAAVKIIKILKNYIA